jgi:uncharacterized membrane protein
MGAESKPPLTRIVTTSGLTALEACSVGLAGWVVRAHRLMPAYARDNAIPWWDRRWVFINMGGALGVAAAVSAAVLLWKRREGPEELERLVRRLAPLSLAALAAFLFDHRLWMDRDIPFLCLALVFGAGARAAFLTSWSTRPVLPLLADAGAAMKRRWKPIGERLRWATSRLDGPLLTVAAGALAYAVYFSAITLANHRNFGSSAFDLGGAENLMWNLIHGGDPRFKSTTLMGPTGWHLSRHAFFFAYVLAPIYWVAPHPETLLIVAATMLGGAAVVLHLYARRHVPPWTSATVALLYLIYAPLHGANLYDFQFLPLAIPLLWLVLHAVETERWLLGAGAAVLALSVREDVGFCLAVLGLYLWISGAHTRAGAALAAAGTVYFLAMKLGIMPLFSSGSETFVNQYAGLLPQGENSFAGVLKTIVGNPPFVAHVVLEDRKLVYVLQLLVPALLLPIARPTGLLLVLPGFLFTLLSTGYEPLYQISFQYTAYWIPFVFVGVVAELERFERAHTSAEGREATVHPRGTLERRALLAGVVAASVPCSYLYGAILPHESLRAGFNRPRFASTPVDVRRRAELAALVAQLPADAKLSASEQLVPHVSGRRVCYTLRFGVHEADYVLFEVPGAREEAQEIAPLLRAGTFGIVDDRGDMALAQRGQPTALNAAILPRITH